MVKEPFKGLQIAITGEFGKERPRKQLKQWIEVNDGQVATTISEDVTHLVCAEADFKNNVEAVVAANDRDIPIVSYDWMEDSIMKRRLLSIRNFQWQDIIAKKEKENAKRRKKEGVKLNKDARNDIFSGESDNLNKSFGRQVMDSFMTKMGTTATTTPRGRATKAKTPRTTKAGAATKPRAKKGKASKTSATTAAEVEPTSEDEINELFLAQGLAERGKKRKRGPIAFTNNGNTPIYDISIPRVNKTLIIRAPTAEEIKQNLVEEANRLFAFPENHHVYRDPASGLDLAIMLVRVDISRNNGGERVFLRLYESNMQPHTYAAFFRHVDRAGETDRIMAPLGADFVYAFDKFTTAFRDYTYVDWMHRDKASMKEGVGLKPAKKFQRSDDSEVNEPPFMYLKNQPVELARPKR